jgi:DNA-binding HxlR family transcriptional regulator
MYKCPVFQVADLVGKRWTIVVIQEIALNGTKGFNAIHSRMKNVSPKLLSARLKELKNAGIISKKILANEMPARTSYSLTEKGKELNKIITDLRKWQARHTAGLENCERKECVSCHLY